MVAFTFAPMILSKASSVSLASGPNTGLTAALHTRMSMPPHCLIVPSTSASTSLRRDTLHGMTIASPPFSLMLAATASSRCSLGYGGKTSAKRSPQQSETARFWLMVGPPAYHPFVRQLVTAKQMSVGDSARLMALAAVGLNEALIAVFNAKYHYNFWRPITSIRNGDIDSNPATDREATWQPIDNTPMHPEYPCAHCILSGSVSGVIKAVLGTEDVPEIAITSPAAPGVTHRFTNLTAFTEEVANARIWAGFHYRFSTRVGTDMGRQIGEYVVKNVMQPAVTAEPQQLPRQGLVPVGR